MPGGEETTLRTVDKRTLREVMLDIDDWIVASRDPMRRVPPRVESGDLKCFCVLLAALEGTEKLGETWGVVSGDQLQEKLYEVLSNHVQRFDGYVRERADSMLVAVFAGETLRLCGERATHAAISVRDTTKDVGETLLRDGVEVGVRIGICVWELSAEAVQSAADREAAIGDAIAVAQKVAGAAKPGTLLVTQELINILGDSFVYGARRAIASEDSQEAAALVEVVEANIQTSEPPPHYVAARVHFVGRARELSRMEEFYSEVAQRSYPPEMWRTGERTLVNRNRFLGVKAADGYGKSSLVHEFVRRLRFKGISAPPIHLMGECPVQPASYLHPFEQMVLSRLDLPRTANPTEKAFALDILYFELEKKLPQSLDSVKERLRETKIAVGHLLRAAYDYSGFSELDAAIQHVEKQLGVKTLLEALYYHANLPLLGKLHSFWEDKPKTLRSNIGRPGAVIPPLPVSIPARPLMLQIEDLHWAQESTVKFLQSLFETMCIPQPVIFVATYLSEFELPRAWRRSLVPEEIDLGGLADYELRMMLKAMLAGFKYPVELEIELFRAVNGNPYFLEELVYEMLAEGLIEIDEGEKCLRMVRRLGTFQMPESLSELAIGRIGTLEPPLRRTVQDAGVLGRQFSLESFEQLEKRAGVKHSARELSERLHVLERTGFFVHHTAAQQVLDTRRRVYSFRHPSLQEAAYRRTPSSRRAALHMIAEDLLDIYYADFRDEYLNSLAYHLEEAGNMSEAARHWIDYGRRVLAQGVFEESRQVLERARDLIRRMGGDPETRVKLDLEAKVVLTKVLLGLRRHQDAEQMCGEVRALARAHELPLQLSDAECILGIIMRERHRYIDAEEHLRAALKLAQEHNDVERELQGQNNLAMLYWELQRHSRARAMFDAALKLSRKIGQKRLIAAALSNAGVAHAHTSRFREGSELLERSLAIANEIGDRWKIIGVLGNMAFFWSNRGRYDKAKGFSAQAEEMRMQLGIKGRGLVSWWV